jgi:OmpA-OmpF porin, OOP family
MKSFSKLIFVSFLAVITLNANGQNLKDRLNKAVNNAAKTVGNAVGNKGNNQQQGQQQNTEKDQQVQQPEAQPEVKEASTPKQEEPGFQAYSKYDFIAGEKVIFYEDFSQDAVGDFPALWNTNGSAEIATTNLFPGKWMKFTGDGAVWTDQLLKLPENYTIEFDIIPISSEGKNMDGYTFRLMESINAKAVDHGAVPGKAGFSLSVPYYGSASYRTYINTEEGRELALSGQRDEEAIKQKLNKKYHIAIWVQKARVRLYLEENKLFDLPKAFNVTGGVKMDRIRFESGALMVTNIRIAVGAPDMRSKLITEGKLVTYGIYFDVNKDAVKPESYGTLKEIAAVLNENPSVRVKIIGHTDADGDDAANLELSKKRAVSVKNELARTFAIDAARIETDGAGETKPVAPNDSPVNKALNRRVEFVKL